MSPKLLKLVKARIDCANYGGDVCEGAAVIPENDSNNLALRWCGTVERSAKWMGALEEPFPVDALALVEVKVEVVLLGNLFHQIAGLAVQCVGCGLPEWRHLRRPRKRMNVFAVEGW